MSAPNHKLGKLTFYSLKFKIRRIIIYFHSKLTLVPFPVLTELQHSNKF